MLEFFISIDQIIFCKLLRWKNTAIFNPGGSCQTEGCSNRWICTQKCTLFDESLAKSGIKISSFNTLDLIWARKCLNALSNFFFELINLAMVVWTLQFALTIENVESRWFLFFRYYFSFVWRLSVPFTQKREKMGDVNFLLCALLWIFQRT